MYLLFYHVFLRLKQNFSLCICGNYQDKDYFAKIEIYYISTLILNMCGTLVSCGKTYFDT